MKGWNLDNSHDTRETDENGKRTKNTSIFFIYEKITDTKKEIPRKETKAKHLKTLPV